MTSDATEQGTVTGSLQVAGDAGSVRLEARLAAGVEEVWDALTDRARLGEWLGTLEGDLRPGEDLRAHWLASGWEGSVRVEQCEPPARLLVRTASEGEPGGSVELTLTADGERTVLVVVDGGLPLDNLAAYGAGNQIHVEDLAAHLSGGGRCDARTRFGELHPRYQEQAARL